MKAAGTPEEAATSFSYDLLGRQKTAALGEPSSKTYNTLSQVLSETDFDGILTTRVFDKAGRVVAESVGGKTTTTAFDGLGRTVRTTDAAGRTVRYTYGAFGRMTTEVHEVAGAEVKRTETAYDTLSRPVQVVQSPAGVTSTLSYATAANKVSVATVEHAGLTTQITYDEFGRETARTVTGAGVALTGAVTARDAEGRRVAWSIGDVASSAGYDAAGKLVSQTAPGINAAYTYDPETARKTAESIITTGAPVASSYAYTDAGRLQGATTGPTQRAYAFDARGNLELLTMDGAQTTFVVDANDRLTSSVTGGLSTSYFHDPDLGRRTSQTASGVTTLWTYDDASRLTGWQRGTDSAAYTYDGNGQRTSATVTAGGTTTTTDYAYDGITLLSLDAARSDETTYAVAYLYDEDGRPYAGVYTAGTASPVTFLIATTDRGDVVALTDTAGAPFARYTYDPYGAVLTQDSNAVTGITSDVAAKIAARQPLRYAGYAYDAHSATYYLSQRHYDPATMRFLTKDPARDDGEESAYQYCAGDPVGKVDPTGLYAMPTRKRTFRLSTAWAVELRLLGRIIRRSYLEVTERLKSRIDPVRARIDYKVDVVVCAADAVSAIPGLKLGSGIAKRVLSVALNASAKRTSRKTLERTYWRFPYHGWKPGWGVVRWPASQGNRGPIPER